MSIPAAAVLFALALMSTDARAGITRSLVDVLSRPGVTQQFLYATPDAPVANLVSIRGFGTYPEALRLGAAEPPFVALLAAAGVAVAIVDAPSDHLDDYIVSGAFRQSAEHASDILAVIQYMRQRADVPIWLSSESNGTISVVGVALRLPSTVRLGAILGSPTTVGNNSLLLLQLGSLRLPTLVVAHAMDQCFLSPPTDQPALLAALTSVPAKELIVLTGGIQRPDPCDHGYHEFELMDAALSAAMIGFMDKHSALLGGQPLLPRQAIEFYNEMLDHYFLTHIVDEIAILDAGVAIKGWTRTAQSFKVYTVGIDATSPVCRFYIPPDKGNSHFYGRGTQECAATGASNPSFINEDPRFFHVVLPNAGACPAQTRAVYRVFSNRTDANHRYMVDRTIRDQMVDRGWLAEGDGADLVVMCAPL